MPLRVLALSALLCAACPGPVEPDIPWSTVAVDLDQAIMSVGGTAADDVWLVGATRNVQDPDGPLVLRWDGQDWTRHHTGQLFDLWWVHAFDDGTTFMGGAGGTVLRHRDASPGAFERMQTPGLAAHTVYGVWGASPDDVWAVGGVAGRSCFVWRFDGEAWRDVRLPEPMLKQPGGEVPACLKVWGRGADDVWIVGGYGLVMRAGADGQLARVDSGTTANLFTVHGNRDGLSVVGGGSVGMTFDIDEARLIETTPEAVPLIQGVCLDDAGRGFAVGAGGLVFRREGGGWRRVETGQLVTAQSLHAVWMDPEGGVWAVGGNVLSAHLNQGVLLHRPATVLGASPSVYTQPEPEPTPAEAACPAEALAMPDGASVARIWNEQMLRAIARDMPAPVVHARNLFHVSAAIYDAWAAFSDTARPVFTSEHVPEHARSDAARDIAISHAAYGVLTHRYGGAVGGDVSVACFKGMMRALQLDPDDLAVDGDAPSAIGNRIAAAIIAQHVDDGANEANGYIDTTDYRSNNRPMVVDVPGAELRDVSEWQLMNIAVAETQNGLILEGGVQTYIGPHWGNVQPFALTRDDPEGLYIDPGAPPLEIDTLRDGAVRLLRVAAMLDPTQDEVRDLSPASVGNSPLGTHDGTGYALNPVTGLPYEPNFMKLGDFHRVMSEYWADGPATETPPGHWNSILNLISDDPRLDKRLFGEGPELERLDWDVMTYLALNGAMHDAAIAAWQIKRFFLGARPISIIRWMGQNGQSSNPELPSWHEDGLPLEDGLIELITEASTRPGERHAHLHPYIGEIAVYSWRGEPGDRARDIGGVGWIRAKEWMPYQRRTFVTPAFPGFVSGHSTYSRAGAETLTRLTGTPFFPGGLRRLVLPKGSFLFFENGPSEDIELQWATYYDAADQSGHSRVSGGIHIDADDYPGRIVGATVGTLAVEKARTFWEASEAQ